MNKFEQPMTTHRIRTGGRGSPANLRDHPRGLPDSEGALTCERNRAYIADIAGAVDVPVNADFASGYGASPRDVADNVTRCIAGGVAGLSIEDATGDPSSPLYELPLRSEERRVGKEGRSP